jgi:hypothetical protein
VLRNKRHFEEKNGEYSECLKYSVLIFVEKMYIKCNIWRVAVLPSYIQDARFLKVLKGLSAFRREWNHIISRLLCLSFPSGSFHAVIFINVSSLLRLSFSAILHSNYLVTKITINDKLLMLNINI